MESNTRPFHVVSHYKYIVVRRGKPCRSHGRISWKLHNIINVELIALDIHVHVFRQ